MDKVAGMVSACTSLNLTGTLRLSDDSFNGTNRGSLGYKVGVRFHFDAYLRDTPIYYVLPERGW